MHIQTRKMWPTLVFFAITFGYSWVLAAIIWQMGGLGHSGARLLLIAYMAGPALGALFATFLFAPKRWHAALGFVSTPKLNWVWAVLMPVALVMAATLLDILLGGAHWVGLEAGLRKVFAARGMADLPNARIPLNWSQLVWLQWLVQIPLGIVINGFALLTEELGWRGWLYHRWRAKLGFWPMSIVVGVIWGIWHAPLIVMGFNYTGMPVLGPFLMIGFCTLLAPLLFWVRERGGNVFAASFFHGTVNALAGVGLLVTGFPGFPWRGLIGAGGFMVLGVAVVLLWFFYKPAKITADI